MSDDERRELGASVKTLRESAGLSQVELAKRSRITTSTISNIENGRHEATTHTLRRLAEVLIPDGPEPETEETDDAELPAG